ncbi:MAG: 30S ribosomal protein S16 [Nanoarchaeota archaeon]|nr:30S ribosomal protein S16 [Nanoarchaeota archaeon]
MADVHKTLPAHSPAKTPLFAGLFLLTFLSNIDSIQILDEFSQNFIMLSIRLSRVGKKNQPQFRLIVVDKKRDPFGNYIELLGYYHPITKQSDFKADRINHWISLGAQPSDTVHNLLIKQNIIKDKPKKVKVRPIRLKKEETEKS